MKRLLFIVKQYVKEDISVLKKVLSSGADCVAVDVRERYEYSEGHINKTVNIPINELNLKIAGYATDRAYPIYVLCAYGDRSKKAAKMLLKNGYTNVTDCGGINKWPYELKSF